MTDKPLTTQSARTGMTLLALLGIENVEPYFHAYPLWDRQPLKAWWRREANRCSA